MLKAIVPTQVQDSGSSWPYYLLPMSKKVAYVVTVGGREKHVSFLSGLKNIYISSGFLEE